MASLVGSSVERKEDKKFLTGKGRYTADITLAHQTHAVFVRSPHARAQIKKVDVIVLVPKSIDLFVNVVVELGVTLECAFNIHSIPSVTALFSARTYPLLPETARALFVEPSLV